MPYDECRIRLALKRDIPDIEDACVEAFGQYRNTVPPPVFETYIADLRRLATYWNEADVLVAELQGRLAGSVLFYGDASLEGWGLPAEWAGFRKLAVRPDMRGRSIGQSLIHACIGRARRRKAPAIGIHSASFMTAARHIYERMGFERVPHYDLNASRILDVDGGMAEFSVAAYYLDVAETAQERADERT